MLTLRRFTTATASPAVLGEVRALLDAAFDGDFAAWPHIDLTASLACEQRGGDDW